MKKNTLTLSAMKDFVDEIREETECANALRNEDIEHEQCIEKKRSAGLILEFLSPQFEKLFEADTTNTYKIAILCCTSPLGFEYYNYSNYSHKIYLGTSTEYTDDDFFRLINEFWEDYSSTGIEYEKTVYGILFSKTYSEDMIEEKFTSKAKKFIDTYLNNKFNEIHKNEKKATLEITLYRMENAAHIETGDGHFKELSMPYNTITRVLDHIRDGYANKDGVYRTTATFRDDLKEITFKRTFLKEENILKDKAREFIQNTVIPYIKDAHSQTPHVLPSVSFLFGKKISFWHLGTFDQKLSSQNFGFNNEEYDVVKMAAEILQADYFSISADYDTILLNGLTCEAFNKIRFYIASTDDYPF